MTAEEDAAVDDGQQDPTGPSRWWRGSGAGVYGALAIVAAGFVAIVVAWGLVAGEPSVSEQLPTIVGLGIGGVGLVLAGSVALATVVVRRDGVVRREHLAAVTAALDEVRRAVADGRSDP